MVVVVVVESVVIYVEVVVDVDVVGDIDDIGPIFFLIKLKETQLSNWMFALLG